MDTRYDMGSYTFQMDAAKTKTKNISIALIRRMMLDIDDESDLAFMLKQNTKPDFCKKYEVQMPTIPAPTTATFFTN